MSGQGKLTLEPLFHKGSYEIRIAISKLVGLKPKPLYNKGFKVSLPLCRGSGQGHLAREKLDAFEHSLEFK